MRVIRGRQISRCRWRHQLTDGLSAMPGASAFVLTFTNRGIGNTSSSSLLLLADHCPLTPDLPPAPAVCLLFQVLLPIEHYRHRGEIGRLHASVYQEARAVR